MGLWSGYSCHLVSPCSHDLYGVWTINPQSRHHDNFLGLLFIYFHPSFGYICMLYFYLYQSSLWSFCSTPWCSRPEGKKTDKYNVSCHIWIVLNFPAIDSMLWRDRFLFEATFKPFHYFPFSLSNGNGCISFVQLANKSYNLRHTDARI